MVISLEKNNEELSNRVELLDAVIADCKAKYHEASQIAASEHVQKESNKKSLSPQKSLLKAEKLCYQFRDTQTCTRGNSCKFQHVLSSNLELIRPENDTSSASSKVDPSDQVSSLLETVARTESELTSSKATVTEQHRQIISMQEEHSTLKGHYDLAVQQLDDVNAQIINTKAEVDANNSEFSAYRNDAARIEKEQLQKVVATEHLLTILIFIT